MWRSRMKQNKMFFLVGAAKAGTSSLYELLTRHPQVFPSPMKEPHYFAFAGQKLHFRGPGDAGSINATAITDRTKYQKLFHGASPDQLCGEASVSYLYVSGTAERIAAECPDAKILAILRNPVQRAYSSYLYMRSRGREPAETFADALDQEEERIAARWQHIFHYYHMGLYAEQIESYVQTFPAEQVCFLFYDDLRRDLKRTVRGALEFLGVASDIDLGKIARRNVSGIPRHRIFDPLLRDGSPVGRTVRRGVPRPIRRWIGATLRSRILRRPALDLTVARQLSSRYAENLERLETMLNRPLPKGWRESV